MKKVIIIGGNGHGSIISSCINDNKKINNEYDIEVVGFLNDFEKKIDNYDVIGGLGDVDKFLDLGYYFAWGIHLIGNNVKTKEVFDRLRIPSDRLVTIIHHTAFIGEDVIIGNGCLVMPNVYIAPRTQIGIGTMIKSNVSIGHDVYCGELCHFAMGSIIGSFTKIGTCSDVSLGSIVLEHKIIGNFAMLGAGSLATHDIPDYEIHVGSPAKFLKRMGED